MLNTLGERERCVAVVGLGYVGLPLAVAFARRMKTIGFDISQEKVQLYEQGIDVTNEVGNEEIQQTSIQFTYDPSDLRKASYIVVAVPTPIDRHNNPDLRPLQEASILVGRNLTRGTVVIYESTVYPGATEEVCIPLLEKESGLCCGVDFKIGYSPERINPGDKVHRLESITKVVSGMDEEALESIASLYSLIIDAGVYRASTIKVAEAAKVIENAQRDINIAFVNELSMIFHKLDIDTLEVMEAAGTKWNFLNFRPGLVGGHCIGVDPFYLTHKAQEVGYIPEVILAGRRINDAMGKYVAENIVKNLIKDDCSVKGAKVLIRGVTFKENVSDVRNSKIADIVAELKDYGVEVFATDPYAESEHVLREYGFSLATEIPPVDAVVVAVNHKEYMETTLEELRGMLAPERNVLVDIKGIYNKHDALNDGFKYWRL